MTEKENLMEAIRVIVNLRIIYPDCCEYCTYRQGYKDDLCPILRMGWDLSIDDIVKDEFMLSHICDLYQK